MRSTGEEVSESREKNAAPDIFDHTAPLSLSDLICSGPNSGHQILVGPRLRCRLVDEGEMYKFFLGQRDVQFIFLGQGGVQVFFSRAGRCTIFFLRHGDVQVFFSGSEMYKFFSPAERCTSFFFSGREV